MVVETAPSLVERARLLADTRVALLTAGQDRPYAFGLAMSLSARGVCLDVIGSDAVDSPEMHTTPNMTFFNLRGSRSRDVGILTRMLRVLGYYARLIGYSVTSKAKIFHILWNNKFEHFDRTVLMMYYKLCGKKIVLTAHNVNIHRRDGTDSALNRFTLWVQYRLADHIFVHTSKMKAELVSDFSIPEEAITIISHPINNAFPETPISAAGARQRLGIGQASNTILFFGRIGPYKGLDYLVSAFQLLSTKRPDCQLIIAGEPKGGAQDHLREVQKAIDNSGCQDRIIRRIEFIPDEDIELYFKAADVLVLPYREIFQSGVLFLGYTFGTPVVAADVGSFKEDVISGQTGFLCRPNDSAALAEALDSYFASELYKNLECSRRQIREYVNACHSWEPVATATHKVYTELLGE